MPTQRLELGAESKCLLDALLSAAVVPARRRQHVVELPDSCPGRIVKQGPPLRKRDAIKLGDREEYKRKARSDEVADGVRTIPIKEHELGARVEDLRGVDWQFVELLMAVVVRKVLEGSTDEVAKRSREAWARLAAPRSICEHCGRLLRAYLGRLAVGAAGPHYCHPGGDLVFAKEGRIAEHALQGRAYGMAAKFETCRICAVHRDRGEREAHRLPGVAHPTAEKLHKRRVVERGPR